MSRGSYLWRAIRRGLGFGIFGAGAVVVGVCLVVLLGAGWGHGDRRAQRVVHLACRLWVWSATRVLRLFRVRSSGIERLRTRPPCIVVANHPTLIDIVLLLACMPQADCVVKRAAWRNPFLKWVVNGAGYVRNDGGATLVDVCAERVRHGRWLVLFPEGTRSPARDLGAFHRGAAHVALRTGAPLLPVVITCDPPTLMKQQKWYDAPPGVLEFTVEVGEPIACDLAAAGVGHGSAARRLMAEMREDYERRLGYVRG